MKQSDNNIFHKIKLEDWPLTDAYKKPQSHQKSLQKKPQRPLITKKNRNKH